MRKPIWFGFKKDFTFEYIMITYNLDLKKSKVYLKSPNITEINKTLFKNKFTSIKVGKKLNFFLITKR